MSSSNSTPVIFTLDSQTILNSPIDIMGYLLRYYLTAPKSVSNTTYSYMISLIDTMSRYESVASNLTQQVTQDLTVVFNRFFLPGSSIVNVTSEDNGDGTYNLIIGLAAIVNGQSYTLGADVSVNNNGILTLKWHPQFN